MKTCTKCKQTKSRKDFYKQSLNKDGLKSYCIECSKIQKQVWYNSLDKGNPHLTLKK